METTLSAHKIDLHSCKTIDQLQSTTDVRLWIIPQKFSANASTYKEKLRGGTQIPRIEFTQS